MRGGLYNPRPVDDVPVNGQLQHGVTSNRMFDHAVDLDLHIYRKLKPNITPRWTVPGWFCRAAINRVILANTIYFIPIFVNETTTYIRIALEVAAAVAGTADLRIFEWDNGVPGALILSAGTVNTGAIGVKEIVIAQELTRAYYFLAYRGTAAPTLKGMNIDSAVNPPLEGLYTASSPPICPSIILAVTAAYADPAPAPASVVDARFAALTLREAD